ncbi:Arm DNA-binding domain-containing protein, partial [Pseudoalteromonas piscicida]
MLRYTIAGKRSEMTIGKHSLLSLADARNKAIEHKMSVN